MKKNMIYYVIAVLLLCMLVGGHIYATVIPDYDKETKANIKFIPNTEEVTPVDPDTPGNPDPGLPPANGPLAILHVSEFSFGEEPITGKKQEIDITTTKANIQIADLRGNGAGWSLDVSVSGFENESQNPTLKGSLIHIKNSRLNSETAMTYAPTAHAPRELTTDDEPVRIMTAQQNQGQGIWVNQLYPQNVTNAAFVQLEVPAGIASTGTHTATMTWMLYDTP